MLKFVTGSLLAALALFFFGFVYWTMSPAGDAAMLQADDDAAVQAALSSVLTESGSYYVPGHGQDEEAMVALYEAGPLAVIHFKAEGRPMMQASTFVQALLHSFATALLLGFLMRLLLGSLPTYRCRVGFAALVGGLCTLFAEGGGHIWWLHSGSWTLAVGLYDLLAFVVMGAILAAFIKPVAAAD